MRVGLVFGGGGVLGGAWMIGGLHALVSETGWNVRDTEVVVGTSAGAVIGTVGAVGRREYFRLPDSPDEVLESAAAMTEDLRGSTLLHAAAGARRRLPGSLGMMWSGLSGRHPRPLLSTLTGLLPSGRASTEEIKSAVRAAVPDGWPQAPRLYITATDYETGLLTVFGRRGAPAAQLADAVAASCAVPGLYEPVRIGGRLYVDGGVGSVSNLDVVAGERLDVVIVFNPLSSRHRRGGLNPVTRAVSEWHRRSHDLLLEEAEVVRRVGTRVYLVEPTPEELDARGWNLMNADLSDDVRRLSERESARQLREMGIADALRTPRRARPRATAKASG